MTKYFLFAAGLGLEPRYYAPEAYVLPLDDPAMCPAELAQNERSGIVPLKYLKKTG
jgi:hypothetical protein